MQRRAAAEGDEIVLIDRSAALDGVHARGARHVLRHHLVDGIGRHLRRQPEALGHVPLQRALRRRDVERDGAAGEVLWIDRAQHDIGVGHRGMPAAAAVAGGSGLGAGALRADRDPFQGIEPGDRAAAGADLDHLDHRDAHRQARALEEAGGAVDLEQPRGVRLVVVDQADLGRGATHVVAESPRLAGAGRNLRSKNRAAGRARIQRVAPGKRRAVSMAVRPPPEVTR